MATYLSARPIVVNESSSFADVVVTLSAPATSAVSVNYSYSNSTAGSSDYTFNSGTLTFAVGESSKSIRITINNDSAFEPAESFELTFGAITGAVLQISQAVVTIAANDATPGVPNASIRDTVVDEKSGTAQFVVVLDKPALDTVTLNFATADLNATAGADFTATAGTLTFSPGQTTLTISVPLLDDTTPEGDELFAVNLTAPVGLVLVNTQAVARIVANDAANVSSPVLIVEDPVMDESVGYVDVVVRLSAPSAQEVRVTYRSGYDGNAGANFDEVNYSIDGTLVFAPGETVRTVRVDFTDDTTFEPAESFYFDLRTPVNAVIAKQYAILTIAGNDAAPGTPAISIYGSVVDEKAGVAQLQVQLDKPSTTPVSVNWATAPGTAGAADYLVRSGTIGFLPGETSRTIWVPINDDSAAEGPERFTVNLSAPVGATLAQASASVIIAASDGGAVSAPTITADAVVADEAAGYVDIVFRLSAPSAQQVSVNFSDSNVNLGGSEYGDNYDSTVVFAPGETVRTVRYMLRDEVASDPVESFYLRLSTPVNGVIGSSTVMVSVAANDNASGTPMVSIGDSVVDERAGMAAFVVTLSMPSTEVVSVDYASSASARGSTNQQASSGTLRFLPGETARTIFVPMDDDSTAEGDDFFSVTLSGPVNATLG